MRRMYSEQELTKIIGEVFDQKIEAGAFNDSIADAVDAYLTEHPVDITALEGLDISVGSLTSTGAISAASGAISGNLSVEGYVEQGEYNFESESATLNSEYLNGLTVLQSYIKCVKVNRHLDVIVSCNVQNQTEASITTVNNKTLLTAYIELPSAISSKIVRKDGSTCNNAFQQNDAVANSILMVTNPAAGAAESINALLTSASANKLQIWMATSQTFTVPAGEKRFLDWRLSILL